MVDRPAQPPVLDYGHHEPTWKAVARVQRAEARLGWMNVLRYWLWYYGGPKYLCVALAIGAAVAGGMAWATFGVAADSAVCFGGIIVWAIVALRPTRREF